MPGISYIEVKGRFGMPSPCSAAPSSYGREWALLSPGSELCAKVRARYAAIARTICLDIDAFLARSRWDLERSHPPAAIAVAAAACVGPARHACVDAGECETAPALPRSVPKKLRPSGTLKASRRGPTRRPSYASWRWASGIGTLGALALLAWIAVDRFPPHAKDPVALADQQALVSRGPASDAPSIKHADASPEALSKTPSSFAALPSQADVATHPARANAAASAGAEEDVGSDLTRSPTPASIDNTTPVISSTVPLGSVRSTRHAPTAVSSRHAARDGESAWPPRRDSDTAASRDDDASAPLATDDFDIRAYADLAAAWQRDAVTPRDGPRGSDTEWADHVSQRRLTDVSQPSSK